MSAALPVEESLPRFAECVREGFSTSLHSAVQIYVSVEGIPIADGVVVDEQSDSKVTRDTLMPLLSAAKPLTAVAVMQLVESGRLNLDRPVADVIPEFAQGGKESITLRHLLTHTGGFRNVKPGWPHATWQETLQRQYEATLEDGWIIGETGGYHVSSSWFVLGELIQRATRCAFSEYLQRYVCQPLGMTSTRNGMTAEEWRQFRGRIGILSQLAKGKIVELPWHDEPHCTAPSPGGNTRGPIRELGRFYECLLNEGELDGIRILSKESVRLMTRRQRKGVFDQTLQHTVDFGLGIIIDSNRYGADTVPYSFGLDCSERTFGHGGSQSSIGFADPERQLVVCYAADRRVTEGRHQKRHRQLLDAIENDLGLRQPA